MYVYKARGNNAHLKKNAHGKAHVNNTHAKNAHVKAHVNNTHYLHVLLHVHFLCIIYNVYYLQIMHIMHM